MTAKWKQIESYINSKSMHETRFNVNKKQAQMILDLKKDELKKMRFLAMLDIDKDELKILAKKDPSIVRAIGRQGGSFRTSMLRKRANEEVDLDESSRSDVKKFVEFLKKKGFRNVDKFLAQGKKLNLKDEDLTNYIAKELNKLPNPFVSDIKKRFMTGEFGKRSFCGQSDLDERRIPAEYHIRVDVDGAVDSRSARQVEKDLKRKGIRDADVQPSFKGNDYLQVKTFRTEKDVKKGLMDIGVEVNEDEVKEDAPTNAVAHGGVDMNPTGLPKKKKKLYDGRTKEYKLHRRNLEAQREKRLKKLKAQKDTLCGSFRENLDIYTVKEDNVAILKKIVKDKRNMPVKLKDGQMKVDLYTASAIVQVYDNMKKPDLKKKLEFIINKGNKAKFLRLVNVVFK
jgi:hypothetical protein